MNASDILELIRAGYTKADIDALGVHLSGSEDPPADPPADPPTDPPTDPPADPLADPKSDDALNKRLEGLETRLNHIINKMTLDAVKGSRQPSEQAETTDEILAAFVRGQKKEE